MPGYNVTSGAAAFSGTLEDAMLQREQAKRQAMLDQLALRQDAREATEHQQNSSLRAQELKERIAEHQDNNRFKDMAETKVLIKDLPPGEIPPPELMAKAKQHGIPLPITPPLAAPPVPGMTPPDMAGPKPGSYMGSPAQQQEVADTAAQKQYEKAHKGTPIGEEAEFNRLYGRNPSASAVVPKTSPTPQVGSFGDYLTRLAPGGDVSQLTPPMIDKARHQWGADTKITVNSGGLPTTGITDPIDKLGAEAGLTPTALAQAGQEVALGGKKPAIGRTATSKNLYTSIMDKAGQFDMKTQQFHPYPEVNPNPSNFVLAEAKNRASAKSLQEIQGAIDGIDAFAGAAASNIQSLKKIINKVPETGLKFGDWLTRATATQVGDEDVAQFNVFMNSLPAEFNRLVNQPKISGVAVSVQEQEHIRKVLDKDAPVKATLAALEAYMTESSNRRKSYQNKVREIEKRMSESGSGAGPDEPSEPTKKASLDDLRKKYSY